LNLKTARDNETFVCSAFASKSATDNPSNRSIL